MTATMTFVDEPIPGLEPPTSPPPVAPVSVQERLGMPLEAFNQVDAMAVADRWVADRGYPLHAHLYDWLTHYGFLFDCEDGTDREIYNGLFDWIVELSGERR